MSKIIYQTFVSFMACIFFSLTFNTPKKELPFCGFTGAVGWCIYCIVVYGFKGDTVIGSFLGAATLTASCRFLSHIRQAPSTLYLIPGILPLVPGSYIYNTMYGILDGDMVYSYTQGVLTAKIAGVIALGVMIILSLPYSCFNFIKK